MQVNAHRRAEKFCRPPVRIALDDEKMGNISKI